MTVVNDCSREIYSGLIKSDAYSACKEVSRILRMIQVFTNINNELYFDVKVILNELIQNAIKHGNDWDNNKKIGVDIWLKDNMLSIQVKDQGCGFDPSITMNIVSNKISVWDPLCMDESGRGLFIVKSLCDFMEFNATGNTITVTKKL